MAFIGRTCGKIQTRKIRKGESHSLMLVHNFRHPLSRKPRFDVIFNFGTIRSYHLSTRAASMWKQIIFVLDRLAANGDIYQNDAARAKAKFAELLGEPTPPAPAPVPVVVPKPKTSLSTGEERLREKYPDMF